jgi:hypothetical protein
MGETKSLGYRAAAGVIDSRTDLDPVEPPRTECVIDEGTDGASHGAAALCVSGQPVADAGRAVLPGDAVEPDHPGDLAVLDGRG